MPIGNGGIIGPANVPTLVSAKGVWSLREAQLAQRQGIWPLGLIPDPDFEYTTLLLPGNGTNGATNNSFLDSSGSGVGNPTRSGNTTQGTFSPFSQTGWGVYFPSLTVTNQQKLIGTLSSQLGNGNFTFEFGIYLTGYRTTAGAVGTILDQSTGLGLNINELGRLILFERTGGVTIIAPSSSTQVPTNIWTWVTLTRSGNAFTLYFNGSSVATGSSSLSFTETTINIGGRYAAGGAGEWNGFQGYLSNFRFSNTVRSASTPTTPLTSDANTLFLGLQSNRFINSATSAALTVGGNPSVQAFSPFNPTLPWSAATYGGSGYFDGNVDYLSNADNANLRLGTNAFTIQGWVYRNASGATHSIIAKGGASTGFVFQITSTNILRFTHGTTNVDTTTTIPASAWTHVAAVRTDTSTNGFQLYINGVSSATATVSTDFNQTDTLYTGADRSAANVMNGYISGLKYTNGTAESISVPTAPPTATTNVTLLLNFTNAGIYDATSKNDLETLDNTVNGVRISTDQYKFYGSSIYFDGTGTDYLWIQADQPIQRFGIGNFTIELWIRLAATGSARGLVAKGTSTTGWLVSLNSSNQVVFTYGTSTITSSGTVSAGVWTYLAVVREGTGANQTKIYINAVNDGTGTVSTDFTQTSSMYIGANRTGGDLFSGYMQDVRITNYARTITLPTSPFGIL